MCEARTAEEDMRRTDLYLAARSMSMLLGKAGLSGSIISFLDSLPSYSTVKV
jgi:hypothetical protein